MPLPYWRKNRSGCLGFFCPLSKGPTNGLKQNPPPKRAKPVVWGKTHPRKGPNQWFEAKPTSEKGQTNGLGQNLPPKRAKPMVWGKTDLRFGSNQWFEAKPTPGKGQTRWFEAKPTPGKGQTRWFGAKPTPGKGQTRWLDERGASAWGGRAFTPTQSGPASLDVSERQAPKVDALRARL